MKRYSKPIMTLSLGVTAALLLLPSVGRATDPVDRLRKALMVEIGSTAPNFANLEWRKTEAKKAIDDMKSISQLRRAYFLSQWSSLAKPEYIDKKVMPRTLEYYDQINAERDRIGTKLTDAIRQGSQTTESDRLASAAILIAELADAEQPTERRPAGKFASRFTDIVQRMVKSNDILVRQAGLNALGKITPKPADAFEPIKDAMRGSDVGPRRLAAFALSDLVRTAHYRGAANKGLVENADETETLAQAVATAHFGLRPEEKDEQVRGYCLQAIAASARAIKDYGWSGESVIQVRLDQDKKLVLRDDAKKILNAYQQANPALVAAATDGNVRLQLAAFQSLELIVSVRVRVMERLREVDAPIAQAKSLGKYDPLAGVIQGDWIKVASLLERTSGEDDQQLRRSAIDLLESIGAEIEQRLEDGQGPHRRALVQRLAPALTDQDRYVRWSAIRALRHVSPTIVEKDVIIALGEIIVETKDTDPELTQAAATALESLADSESAGAALPYLRSLIGNPLKDVENRVAGMQVLVSLGHTTKHQVTANSAISVVVATLSDADVRIRRAAAETLGRLARPATREIADEAIAALRAALRDDDAEVRLNASEALLNIVIPGR